MAKGTPPPEGPPESGPIGLPPDKRGKPNRPDQAPKGPPQKPGKGK